MFNGFLEPYRKEDGAWDTKALQILGFLLGARNPDALVLAVILIIVLVVAGVNIWFAFLVGQYLWFLYTKRATGNSPKDNALRMILASWIGISTITVILYHFGGFGSALTANILGISFLLFAFGVTQFDKEDKVTKPRQLPQDSTFKPADVREFTKFKGG